MERAVPRQQNGRRQRNQAGAPKLQQARVRQAGSRAMMLPSTPVKQTLSPFRLRRHADYQRVYQASRKYHATSMSYFFRVRAPEEQLQQQRGHLQLAEGPRVGLTVGRVMGKAVDRNRIKRRMREAVRLHLSVLHEAPPAQRHLDLVLHPRKAVATMEFAALEREVEKLFSQVVAAAAYPQPAPAPRPARRPSAAVQSPASSSRSTAEPRRS